jgi:hypothetical protein
LAIGRPDAARYLSCANDPAQPFELVAIFDQPRTWTIAGGGAEGTFTIGVPGTDLTLGLSPLLIYPPMVAMSRLEMDRSLTLSLV